MALFFVGSMVLTLLLIAIYPRSYSSESKLFLQIGRASVALDPTVTTGPTNLLQKTQADEVNSALNILSSRAVLEQAVESVGATRILNGSETAEAKTSPGIIGRAVDGASAWLESVLTSLNLADPCSELDQAIRRLEKRVTVSAPKDSTVITISYSARSPELAHDVVDAITNAFLTENLRLNHSEGALSFFSVQAEKLHSELLAAQAKLRDRKNAFHLTSNVNRQSIIEKSKEALRQKLYDLQVQESDLKSRYTDDYPPLREIRRQRTEAEKQLTDIPPQHLLASGVGPVPQSPPQLDDKPRSSLDSELQAVNDQEFQLSQLELGVQLLEGKYRLHVEKLEQARVNDALERERISSVKIAQAATFDRQPEAPKKRLLFSVGLFLALFGAVGLAFLTECLDQSLRTTEQVEAKLGLPVLLSLPLRPRSQIATAPIHGLSAKGTKGPDRDHPPADFGPLIERLISSRGIRGISENRRTRIIGVAGWEGTTSRSQIATDLAIQAASSLSELVLLINADSRGRCITHRLQIDGAAGWRDVLTGAAQAEKGRQHPVSNLAVLSAGGTNGSQLAVDPAVGLLEQLDEVRGEYGLIVVDLPLTQEAVRDTWPPKGLTSWCSSSRRSKRASKWHNAPRSRSSERAFRSQVWCWSIGASIFRAGCISGCNLFSTRMWWPQTLGVRRDWLMVSTLTQRRDDNPMNSSFKLFSRPYAAGSSRIASQSRLASKKEFRRLLECERALAFRNQRKVSVIIFHSLNRSSSERVIQILAEGLEDANRDLDRAGWMGRNQIGIILPATERESATTVAQAITRASNCPAGSFLWQVDTYPEALKIPNQIQAAAGLLRGKKVATCREPDDGQTQHPQPITAKRHKCLHSPCPQWKRGMDIAGALVGLVALFPLLAAVAVWIKCVSRGAVFFRQKRTALPASRS